VQRAGRRHVDQLAHSLGDPAPYRLTEEIVVAATIATAVGYRCAEDGNATYLGNFRSGIVGARSALWTCRNPWEEKT
jgi:hypothetical protein